MFIAMNNQTRRVIAHKSLPKDADYFCPICNGKVRLRVGDINTAHFSHIHACSDDFTHDMSEWHKSWQMLFPLKNREVVISNGNETHRADVLCYGTVIEFQHSPISESEFWRRNDFYTSAGYKVVWIFDVIDLFDNLNQTSRLYCDGDWNTEWDYGSTFRWKHPWRFLRDFMPQDEKEIDIILNIVPFGDDPKNPDSEGHIEKVVWVNPYCETPWSRFRTNYEITDYSSLLEWLKDRWLKEQQIQR